MREYYPSYGHFYFEEASFQSLVTPSQLFKCVISRFSTSPRTNFITISLQRVFSESSSMLSDGMSGNEPQRSTFMNSFSFTDTDTVGPVGSSSSMPQEFYYNQFLRVSEWAIEFYYQLKTRVLLCRDVVNFISKLRNYFKYIIFHVI